MRSIDAGRMCADLPARIDACRWQRTITSMTSKAPCKVGTCTHPTGTLPFLDSWRSAAASERFDVRLARLAPSEFEHRQWLLLHFVFFAHLCTDALEPSVDATTSAVRTSRPFDRPCRPRTSSTGPAHHPARDTSTRVLETPEFAAIRTYFRSVPAPCVMASVAKFADECRTAGEDRRSIRSFCGPRTVPDAGSDHRQGEGCGPNRLTRWCLEERDREFAPIIRYLGLQFHSRSGGSRTTFQG